MDCALIFLALATVAALIGFSGVRADAASIAQIAFVILLTLFTLALIIGTPKKEKQ